MREASTGTAQFSRFAEILADASDGCGGDARFTAEKYTVVIAGLKAPADQPQERPKAGADIPTIVDDPAIVLFFGEPYFGADYGAIGT
jgi:hypothetical protein